MRLFLIILDGVGMGELPDAAQYGDRGANTLLHVAEFAGKLKLPVLESLGLGNLLPMPGGAAAALQGGAEDGVAAVGRVVDDRDDAPGEQRFQGVLRVEVSLPVLEVLVGEEELSHLQAPPFERPLVRPHRGPAG